MSNIPSPGAITNVLGVPAELRAINQWIVWKPQVRGGKLTKVPVSYASPLGGNINAHDPMFWATFDEAVAVMQQDPRFGIGLVLDNTGIICLDYDDHAGDDPDAVRNGAAFMADISLNFPTYVERSLQGGGKHAFYKGVLPHGRTGGIIDPLNLEIYAAQFIAITGNAVIGSHPTVNDGQALIDAWNLPPPVATTDHIDPTNALGRALNLTDAEVISTMMVRRASIFNMMASQADLQDRSTAFAQIIGDLDKITGDPRQIDRIIRKSPFFKNAYNSGKYDQSPRWLGKYNCGSMLEYWLQQARRENTESIQYAEILTPERRAFLDKVCSSITYRTNVEAPTERRQELTSHAATDKTLHVDIDATAQAPVARLLFQIEDEIGGEYQSLSVPPGATGEFVNALGTMLTGPRLTYLLPAVISTLAGYLGQTFKTPGFEMGLVTHFVIAGQMNTGKTSTMAVLNKAIDLALSGWYRNPNQPTSLMPSATQPLTHAKRRTIETRAVSVQGLFSAISELGSGCWFADEAESQLQTMSSGNQHGDALKAFYKQTFDKAGAMDAASLDVSRESTKLGVVPILNMNLPTYFSCTSEVFETLREKELVDGTFSRVNMIYDERPMDAKTASEMTLHKGLPVALMQLIQKIAFIADDTGSAYDQGGLRTLQREIMNPKGDKSAEDLRQQIEVNKRAGLSKVHVMQYSPAAAALKLKITDLCRRIGSEANPHSDDGDWPAHYQIMARTDILPVLIAGVLAATDTIASWNVNLGEGIQANWRETMPQVIIEEHHLRWAFEFVMHFRLSFFKAWDQGKIAVQMSNDEVVMERVIRRALRSKDAKLVNGTWWVSQGRVINLANMVSPFKMADRVSASHGRSGGTEMARRTLAVMVEHGTIMRADAKELQLASKGIYVTIVQ